MTELRVYLPIKDLQPRFPPGFRRQRAHELTHHLGVRIP